MKPRELSTGVRLLVLRWHELCRHESSPASARGAGKREMKGDRVEDIDDDENDGDDEDGVEGNIGGDGKFEGNGRASPAASGTSSGGDARIHEREDGIW